MKLRTVGMAMLVVLVLVAGTLVRRGEPGGTIAYVGCSNSSGAVNGYHSVGGVKMWPRNSGYGGGTVVRWAVDIKGGGTYWDTFAANIQVYGATAVWWQLCTQAGNSDAQNASAAGQVLEEIHRRLPGVPIYVSAINGYVAPHVCGILGANGAERMQALAASLDVPPGPAMPDLTAAQTRDGCHPNTEGEALLGDALLEFFG